MLRYFIVILLVLLPFSALAQGVNWELSDELDTPAAGGEFDTTFDTSAATELPTTLLTAPDELALRSGLTENELIELFGEPDAREISQSQQSIWKYGVSSLFLTDGKLIAWTNQQDVLQRARLRGFSGPISLERGFKDTRWKNAWQLREKTTPGEVIDELIRNGSSSSEDSQSSASLELMSGRSSISSSDGSFSK